MTPTKCPRVGKFGLRVVEITLRVAEGIRKPRNSGVFSVRGGGLENCQRGYSPPFPRAPDSIGAEVLQP